MTIFNDIINGKVPSNKVYENEYVLAFDDIHPQAPVHVLIIPKKPIPSIQEMNRDDLFLLQEMVIAAQMVAIKKKVPDGYRLVINNGEQATQTVAHLHMHLLGGRQLDGQLG